MDLYPNQVAGLANIASNYLIAGQEAGRHGTAHPSIAPYEVFECKDGFIMIGAGNNKQVAGSITLLRASPLTLYFQFSIFADKILGNPGIASHPKFSSNASRVANRDELKQMITEVLMNRDRAHWLEKFTGLG